ncbi:MAG: ABC transporter permease, partial [Gemmatimonadota bacterium]
MGGREHREDDLSTELRHHIESEAADLVRQGWEPEAARREAFRRFGGEETTKERVREGRRGRWLADLGQDLAYAARSLRRSPGFTASVLVVLALGIGGSTALFSVVNGILLRPLPYPEPDGVVRVWPAQPNQDLPRDLISYPDFLDWRKRSETLSRLGTYLPPFLPDWTLTQDGEAAEQLATTWVAGDFFSALGAPPAMGRWLDQEDVELERSVVVLSHGAWERLFASDPAVVGRTVSLEFQQMEVVGVMPAGFDFPDPDVDVWVPMHTAFSGPMAGVDQRRGISTQYMVARLADGATVQTAQDELGTIAKDLEATYPNSNAGESAATVDLLQDNVVGEVRGALWSLLGAVAFFLLLATANAANLLLARGTDRAREFALRKSLGASSPRITRQIVTETAALAVVAGLLGIGLGRLLVGAVRSLPADILPRAGSVEIDGTVLLVALVLTGIVTTLAGLAPALRLGRQSPNDVRGSGRSMSADRGGMRRRSLLIAGEVAVAVVLTVGAGLLIRSLNAIGSVDTGLSPDGAIAMTVNAPQQRYQDDPSKRALYDRILERIQAVPGVTVAGATPHLPFRSVGVGYNVNVPGIFEPPPDQERESRVLAMSPTAFEALGTTVIEGRGFTPADGLDDPLVAVVNEAMVQEFFDGRNPIGERIAAAGSPNGPVWEVVGVAEDVTLLGPTESSPSAFFMPLAQYPNLQQMTFVARTDDDPLALVGPMRAIVQELDPEVPVMEIIPLDRLNAEVRARPRFFTSVMAGFAALALILAGLGVYGVLAYVVRGRAKEMGIRAALGATRIEVLRHVMAGGLRPALLGLVVGIGAAALLSRYLQTLLFEVSPLDPIAFVVGASVIALAATLACAVPASWA